MMRRPNGNADARAGAVGAVEQDSSKPAKSATGRTEFQGLAGNARCATQRPPTWTPPAGAAAADDLAAALRRWGSR